MPNVSIKSQRLHIGIFGRRNVGKSTLLNALAQQQISIVSDTPGTTTDPVEKAVEMPLLGPVQFIDTAGIDDEGVLGGQRVERTRQVFDRCDIGIVVTTAARPVGDEAEYESTLIEELRRRSIPVVLVYNKVDLVNPLDGGEIRFGFRGDDTDCYVDALHGKGISELRAALVAIMPEDFLTPPPIVSDLVSPGEMVLLVTPIDRAAPKGRLILPQVQTIRELLDARNTCVVVQDGQVTKTLARLKSPPALVVTDSQAFAQVAAAVPREIPLTSFSILFARQKGDLAAFVEGAEAIDHLKRGSRVVIAEACSHHPSEEDIGTVKIPDMLHRYLKQTKKVSGILDIKHVRGHDFSDAFLSEAELVIHCGGCMTNRREMLSRQLRCRNAGVPMTNYGLAIAFMLGIFERALAPIGTVPLRGICATLRK